MERLSVESPASPDDVLAMAGSRALARKAMLYQFFRGSTVVFKEAGKPIGLAFFVPVGDEVEFCMAFRPGASRHMLQMVRQAHLTIGAIEETGGRLYSHVNPSNRAGRRLMRLTGFERVGDTRWERKPNVRCDESNLRRQFGGEGGRAGPPDPGGGE